jgi:hypothetical protein
MIAEIYAAISQRKQIKLTYNGAVRVINPHVYGADKNGQLRLRGTQQESNGVAHAADWKLFDDAKISEVVILEANAEVDALFKDTDSVIVNPLIKL